MPEPEQQTPWRHTCSFMPANPLFFRVKATMGLPPSVLPHRHLERFLNVPTVRNHTLCMTTRHTHSYIHIDKVKQVFQSNTLSMWHAPWQFPFYSIPFPSLWLITALTLVCKWAVTATWKTRASEPGTRKAGPQIRSAGTRGRCTLSGPPEPPGDLCAHPRWEGLL